jgi:hypothetical protein
MRHLFRQPGSVLLLPHFVIQPAGLGLLIHRARGALLFHACPRRTRHAIAVAMIAAPADHHLLMTTSAVEDPAVWFRHPVSAAEGLYRGQADERCSTEHRTLGANLSRCLRGSGSLPDPHPTAAPDAAISHNPVPRATAASTLYVSRYAHDPLVLVGAQRSAGRRQSRQNDGGMD